MKRTLTKTKARKMAGQRENKRGGRPAVPRPCPKCGAGCASARQAQAHC